MTLRDGGASSGGLPYPPSIGETCFLRKGVLQAKAVTTHGQIGFVRTEEIEQPEEPELSTSPLWRESMRLARKAAGMSQGQLGAAVGVSQAVISDIEKGLIKASSKVMPICRVLRIPPPLVMVDPDIERLVTAALTLRTRSPSLFDAQLKTLETLAAGAPQAAAVSAKRRDH